MSKRLYMRLDGGELEPAEYRVIADADGMGNGRRVDVCCPRCRHVSALDLEIHTVRRDGAVTPIWPCSNEACPFSEWLQLEADQ